MCIYENFRITFLRTKNLKHFFLVLSDITMNADKIIYLNTNVPMKSFLFAAVYSSNLLENLPKAFLLYCTFPPRLWLGSRLLMPGYPGTMRARTAHQSAAIVTSWSVRRPLRQHARSFIFELRKFEKLVYKNVISIWCFVNMGDRSWSGVGFKKIREKVFKFYQSFMVVLILLTYKQDTLITYTFLNR